MALVIKDGIVMGCQNDTQLAAFLSSGWSIYKPEAVKVEAPAPEDETVKKAKKTAVKKR